MEHEPKSSRPAKRHRRAPWLLALMSLFLLASIGLSPSTGGLALSAASASPAASRTSPATMEGLSTGDASGNEGASDGPMLDARVDRSKAVVSIGEVPPGFPAEDRFDGISQACVQLTKELAPRKYRRAVYDYCELRSYSSSRYNVIKSKVDESQAHDRDRPFAWRFYNRGIINGHLDPDNCPHHAIDRTIKHPRNERKLAANWPFNKPKMTAKLKGQWFDHAHDMERFGTRGPHDNHLGTAVVYVPGCYPPEALDRNDVNATVTIRRAIAICEDYGCRSRGDIRKHWRHGPKRKRKG